MRVNFRLICVSHELIYLTIRASEFICRWYQVKMWQIRMIVYDYRRPRDIVQLVGRMAGISVTITVTVNETFPLQLPLQLTDLIYFS